GWPMPRLMMSRPCAASAVARASTAKAFSSPMRSNAAMVCSMCASLPDCPTFRPALQPITGGKANAGRTEKSPGNAPGLLLGGASVAGRIGRPVALQLRADRRIRIGADHVVGAVGPGRIPRARISIDGVVDAGPGVVASHVLGGGRHRDERRKAEGGQNQF